MMPNNQKKQKLKSGHEIREAKRKRLRDLSANAEGQSSLHNFFPKSNNQITLVSLPTNSQNETTSQKNNLERSTESNELVDQPYAETADTDLVAQAYKEDNFDVDNNNRNINNNNIQCENIHKSDDEDYEECEETSSTREDDVTQTCTEKTSGMQTALALELKLFVPPKGGSSVLEKNAFLRQHPIQPKQCDFRETKFPFNESKVYYKRLENGEYILRQWISYSVKLNKLFCSVCMAYSSQSQNSIFTTGFNNFKTVYQRISDHETSNWHKNAVEAYFQNKKEKNIENYINRELQELKNEERVRNRLVAARIIDIIIFIGKQGISFRGKNESAYFLNEEISGRGNFLELILLIAKYDEILKQYVGEVTKKSRLRKLKNPTSRGRGNLVTLLSKSTINKLMKIILSEMRNMISEEVQKSGMYSIQVDSTQDVSVHEQCSVVIRYVDCEYKVQERLLSLITIEKSTGLALKNYLQEVLKVSGISENNIVGCSFDGAANMSGQYNGLQAQIKTICPNSVYTWCYAHILNLVVGESTQCCVKAKTYFGLLNRLACFFSESYKRIAVWEEHTKALHKTSSKLKKIGETRWWSKSNAVQTLLGNFQNQDNEIYSTVLLVLQNISTSTDFDAKTCSEASSYLQSFCKYETILLSFLFLQLFEFLTPASNYLQTEGIDFMQAYYLVEDCKNNINSMFDCFDKIKEAADKFACYLINKNELADIEIADQLPQVRTNKIKRMPGEKYKDSPITDPYKKFEIETYKIIINQSVNSIEQRFEPNRQIYRDFSLLDPRNFKNISSDTITQQSLSKLAENINVNASDLQQELLSFCGIYNNLERIKTDLCLFIDKDNGMCKGCIHCTFSSICKYNMYVCTFPNLYRAYKYLLTLSCTQVYCERLFSILKIIKSPMRSKLGQDILQALMLINIERDLLKKLDSEKIIDILASESRDYRKMLLV